MTSAVDSLIVGGGFYGLYLAEFLAGRGGRVVVCERGPGVLRRASYHNQARVHNGYHYPRSVLTAVRSRVNFPRFVAEFRPAVVSAFDKVYAVARLFSKVSADQFHQGMTRIGAAVRPAPAAVKRLFDPAHVEEVFAVTEYAFDAAVLARIMSERIQKAGVELRLGTEVARFRPGPGETVVADLAGAEPIAAGQVFVCGYSQLNAPFAASGLPVVPLKHELTEMPLVDVPPELKQLGVTVMDGPFFSCMPFPDRRLHTLSHVRYTPHGHWRDDPDEPYRPAYAVFDAAPKRTAFPHMVRDAARLLPSLAGCEYRGSLWEVKTVLPRSETDDSRPILFRPDHGLPNLHAVMGGKIDNVYDVADVIAARLGSR